MMKRIEPRTLKGFRDYLPEIMIPREQCMQLARTVFRRFGFAPIDTPALEYLEILTGKGSEETDRQMYRFTDSGGREVGMRFDLTVPLARFAAQHVPVLGIPFKRYHIGTVWRGETPQAGRFREFIQCDFDTIGTESVVADIEIVTVISQLMRSLGLDAFKIHLNNRKVLSGLLEHLQLHDAAVPLLRSLDKLPKIGVQATVDEMKATANVNEEQARAVVQLAEIRGTNREILNALPEMTGRHPIAMEGIERLDQIIHGAIASGVHPEQIKLDVGIARGLDYYTGVVFETFLDEDPKIGSVCSGGRYDNLAALYTKQHLPGVGASLGLDRLLAALEKLGKLPQTRTPAPVFIPFFDAQFRDNYLQMASIIRDAGIGCEFYPDAKKLGVQLKYADSRGFLVALIAGSEEINQGTVQIKNLREKISTTVAYTPESPDDLLTAIDHIIRLSTDTLLA